MPEFKGQNHTQSFPLTEKGLSFGACYLPAFDAPRGSGNCTRHCIAADIPVKNSRRDIMQNQRAGSVCHESATPATFVPKAAKLKESRKLRKRGLDAPFKPDIFLCWSSLLDWFMGFLVFNNDSNISWFRSECFDLPVTLFLVPSVLPPWGKYDSKITTNHR